jgi:glyoxylase-like metal-dependent hydrolase (beta-lactamase superfamily II)
MKRGFVLGLLVAVGTLSLSLAAYQQGQGQAPKVVEVEKLRDNLFLLKGGGGNTAVFVMSNGVTVVDTKNPGWGQPILDKIKELTPKPVTRIINTHTHGDHVSGNVEFPATVDVVVQENTAANMKKMWAVTGLSDPNAPPPPNIFDQHNGRGLPKRTFKDTLTIGSGMDRIDLYYFGRGHTNGDAWVQFPALRVIHAGDIFAGKSLPILDANNGGSGVEIGDSLTNAANAIKDVDTIITGHSTTMTMADLREYAQFNKDFLADMRQAKAAGKSVDDVVKSWKMPAKYSGYAAPQPQRLKANVEVVFNELK